MFSRHHICLLWIVSLPQWEGCGYGLGLDTYRPAGGFGPTWLKGRGKLYHCQGRGCVVWFFCDCSMHVWTCELCMCATVHCHIVCFAVHNERTCRYNAGLIVPAKLWWCTQCTSFLLHLVFRQRLSKILRVFVDYPTQFSGYTRLQINYLKWSLHTRARMQPCCVLHHGWLLIFTS